MASVVLIIIAVQLVCVIGIVFILWFVLEKRLVNTAIKELNAYIPVEGEPKPQSVQVVAHKAVSSVVQGELQRIAQSKFGANVRIEYQVDKSLLGGLIITVNKRRFNYCLADRLKEGGFLK